MKIHFTNNTFNRIQSTAKSPSIKEISSVASNKVCFTGLNEVASAGSKVPKGYVLPEIKGQLINDAKCAELNALKLTLADKIRYSKLGIKDKFFQEEAKRLEYIFENNSKIDIAKQYEQILLDITELAKKTLAKVDPKASLKNIPINNSHTGYYVIDDFVKKSIDFYDRVKLIDGTVLSLNNIKAGCQGFASKLKKCPEYILSIIDTTGKHAFIHANTVGNISLINGIIDYMARIGKAVTKNIC